MTAIAIDERTGAKLLELARSSLTHFVQRRELYQLRWNNLPEALQQRGSTFVTLMNQGHLRGCIGSTEAELPLAYDVIRNAAAAACDPRFPPISLHELPDLKLEVSVLEQLQPLVYEDEQDLYHKLQPGLDGVIVNWKEQHALLLPRVWHRVPDPGEFMQILCHKAKIPWREMKVAPPTIRVLIFQAISFEEDGYQAKT